MKNVIIWLWIAKMVMWESLKVLRINRRDIYRSLSNKIISMTFFFIKPVFLEAMQHCYDVVGFLLFGVSILPSWSLRYVYVLTPLRPCYKADLVWGTLNMGRLRDRADLSQKCYDQRLSLTGGTSKIPP